MNKLMYVALVPAILLAIAMVVYTLPRATASLTGNTDATIDISELGKSVDATRLPNKDIAEEYLH